MTPFQRGLQYSLKNEGGWSHHKNDRGGATNFGITIKTLKRWRRRPVTNEEVRNMKESEAEDIYKAWYWDTMDLDLITHSGKAVCMFDIGIVMGIDDPPVIAQKSCNLLGNRLVVDGEIGPKTIAAINGADPEAFIRGFSVFTREAFQEIVRKNSSQAVFLKGWTNRANRLLTLI